MQRLLPFIKSKGRRLDFPFVTQASVFAVLCVKRMTTRRPFSFCAVYPYSILLHTGDGEDKRVFVFQRYLHYARTPKPSVSCCEVVCERRSSGFDLHPSSDSVTLRHKRPHLFILLHQIHAEPASQSVQCLCEHHYMITHFTHTATEPRLYGQTTGVMCGEVGSPLGYSITQSCLFIT